MAMMKRTQALACVLSTLVLMLLLSDTPRVDAYSSGTPDSACATMIPGHGPSRRLHNNPFPIITVSSATYGPLQAIHLVMEPRADAQIKGFFLQARPANDTDADTRIGTFVADEDSKTACNNGAITHRRSAERYSIYVTWRAPPGPAGDIKFRATVVNTFRDYYTDIYSQVVTYQPPTTPSTTTTTEALWEDVTFTEVPPGYTFTPKPSPTTTKLPFPSLPENFTLPPGFPSLPENFTLPPGFPDVPENFTFPPGFPDALLPENFKRRFRTSTPKTKVGTNKGPVTCCLNVLMLTLLLVLSLAGLQ